MVRHHWPAGDRHERADLAIVEADRVAELVDAVAPALVDVVHRTGRRGDVHAVGLLLDLLPYGVLMRAGFHAGHRAHPRLPVLHLAQRGISGLGSGREGLAVAAAVPAPRLDAAHRHAELRAGGDEHGDVERPVLLGAEYLLALVEQDG